jgi:hypothetical protein
MSMFGSIMSKIWNSAESAVGAAPSGSTNAMPTTPAPNGSQTSASASPAAPAQPASAAPQTVDVEAVLSGMASQKGGGGNWQSSIVDLLKLLDLDSSLNARKELASELNLHVGADGSAEENTALHKAVMQKLAENGGKVPASMKG